MSHLFDRGRQAPLRIALVRALRGLGDILTVVPAWRALRAGLPGARVTLIGLAEARQIVERFPQYIDDLLEFPSFPGIPELPLDARAIPPFLAQVQKEPFDLAIQMHGAGTVSNIFTAMLGARAVAGFYLPDQYCPDSQYFMPYPSDGSEVRRYLGLMEVLGWPAQGEELEFPVYDEDRASLATLVQKTGLRDGPYMCIHPGAYDPARRWAAEHFASVGDALASLGLQVVLTGTDREAEITRTVARSMRAPALDIAGCTPLGTLAALLEGARLLICNDTGVSHLAAALHTPSVVVFLASDPNRWAPADYHLHRQVGRPVDRPGGVDEHWARQAAASSTWSLPATRTHAPGLNAIATPRQVLTEARHLLMASRGDEYAA